MENMNNKKLELLSLNEMKRLHGGYWRYDLIDFHYLYNDYFPTSEMTDILKKELSNLIDCYPSTQKTITGIFSKWKEESWFNEDNLIIGNGSSELILLINRRISNVAVPLPIFNEYTQLDQEKVKYFYTKEETGFKVEISELIKFIEKNYCESVVLNNPNNPTGQLLKKNEIIKLLDLGILVIVDEAFIDWSGGKESCEDLIPKYNNLIIIKSLTKITGVGGLRLGYMLTTNEVTKSFVRKNLPIWNINSISERFLELLIMNKNHFLESITKIVTDRDIVYKGLSSIKGVLTYEPNANFIFCKSDINAKLIEEQLFKQYRIMIKAGVNQKGLESNHFFRVAIRSRKENEILINSLKEVLSY